MIKNPIPKNQSSKKINLNDTAIDVLNKRYLLKDVDGNIIETPEDMLWRVAYNIATADILYCTDKVREKKHMETAIEFYSMMADLDFLPNSPTLMNAGTKNNMLSACFVLPIEDSMESIFDTIKNTALIFKSGGGCGYSFSKLRPVNDIVKSTGGKASGPLSFMEVFNSATDVVKQGGTRRGAAISILRIDHPDIMDFIKVKSDLSKLNNFNLSVAISDKFMIAVKNNTDYDIISPQDGSVVKQYNARKIFKQIVKQAWTTGEPGLIFIDEINRRNPTVGYERIEATNPCGELPLENNNSCNLGSINLSKFICSDGFDYDRLKKIVISSIHFLDNVIEMNDYPLDIIDKTTKKFRKVGLGVMGWGDALLKLRIPYSSEKARIMADEVMSFINNTAYIASIDLCKGRGVYPIYNKPYNVKMDMPCRNATRTTIAPTGTISILANCSSGIEPIFSMAFVRNIMDDDKFFEVNPVFEEIAIENGFGSKEIFSQLAKDGTVKYIDSIPDEHKKYFETAHDISPEAHIKMQSVFQKHVDSSISKTINFPKTATTDDVEKAYLMAYDMKCKGVTVYRDGCRENQVLNIGENKKEKIVEKRIKKNRPKKLNGVTYQMTTGCGNIYITLNEDENGNIFEVFNSIGKAGGCAACQSESIGKLISLAFRSGQTPEPIIKQLIGISCHRPAGFGDNQILSCSDAIAKALKSYLEEKNGKKIEIDFEKSSGGVCPECGGNISHESGCQMCYSCGWSAC